MITKEKIQELVANLIDPEKQFLVDIVVRPGNRIVVTLDDYNGISLDDCAYISKKIETNFDREKEDYELEVTSPGLTQPFSVIQQYYKNLNKEVEVLLKNGIKIEAKLISVDEKGIVVEAEKTAKIQNSKKKQAIIEKKVIEFVNIKSTKIVLPF
jgi:ribosome maturation factor RimP